MLIGGSLLLGGGKTYIINITANQNNFNLGTALTAAGWSGNSPVRAQVTISSGVVVGSGGTGTAAFVIPGLPSGSNITLTNNGTISGAGGAGGNKDSSGSSGGSALQTFSPVAIANNATMAGGGGGGGAAVFDPFTRNGVYSYLGGGGGAGTTAGAGASGGGLSYAGNGGSSTAGGSGGVDGTYYAGSGGNLGSAGNGGAGNGFNYPGGSAGNYIIGNSYATWIVTGTRLGGFS